MGWTSTSNSVAKNVLSSSSWRGEGKSPLDRLEKILQKQKEHCVTSMEEEYTSLFPFEGNEKQCTGGSVKYAISVEIPGQFKESPHSLK